MCGSYDFYPLAFQAKGVLSLPVSVHLSIRLSVLPIDAWKNMYVFLYSYEWIKKKFKITTLSKILDEVRKEGQAPDFKT